MKPLLLIVFFFSSFILHAQSPSLNRLLRSKDPVEDQSELQKGEDIDGKIKKNFFLKAGVSKTSCFVGEPVMATFKAYSRLNASFTVVKRPALTGFSVLEMVDGYNNQPEVETVDGVAFNSHLIRKVQLFPLQEGRFSLEPAQVESRIFLRNPNMVKYLSLETPPIAIAVKPLPAKNQPASFSGAVGNFSVALQMNDKTISRYDPATVQLVVSGTGNFPLITDPDIRWPANVEVSSPRVTEDVNRYVYPLSGQKIFEYTLETSGVGRFTIPPVDFSFFDPLSAKYKTASTKEIRYTVKEGRKRINIAGKVINSPRDIPVQYYYFGVLAAAILGWIIFQVVRSSRKK